MITILRELGQFKLIRDDFQKMYRTVNTVLLENTEDEGVSYWFDEDTANVYLLASDKEFIQRCKQSAGNDINKYI